MIANIGRVIGVTIAASDAVLSFVLSAYWSRRTANVKTRMNVVGFDFIPFKLILSIIHRNLSYSN